VRDPRASFGQSVEVLQRAKRLRPDLPTKTGLMVGVGETDDEVLDALARLREADVDLLTMGQYLAPGRENSRFLQVDRFVPPEQFAAWEEAARRLGFAGVAAGPLVRSSYRAETLWRQAIEGQATA
jgi:lipoic acid synthetase